MGLDRTAFGMQTHLDEKPEDCPVCRSLFTNMGKEIDILFYESVNDLDTRERIRRAGGFCHHHTRMVAHHADALGTALIMKDVLTQSLRALVAGTYDTPPHTGNAFSRLREGLNRSSDKEPCPLCAIERTSEERTVDSLLQGLADAEFAQRFRRSHGLCMPHFIRAYERSSDGRTWSIVRDTQRVALEGLIDQLGALADSADYRVAEKVMGGAAESWRRALDTSGGMVDL